ncbi:YsnF/AvaK domain-containing protein, partial [Streptomyces sp. CBMA156]|uniref:YsnF/AvaK domain-containing protein n=1 Tax=Streptomyces sp. CBMA156 TaxID=1930280 RepID=UPI001661A89A
TAGAAGATGAATGIGHTAMPPSATTRAAAAPGAVGSAAGRAAVHHGKDEAMTRSEERMSVGVERYEAGHAKLRKYVVTEEERQTVPVRHEEVHVEHEPITDANRGAAMSGELISEAEYEVTLHAERPVVRTEAVPVERVRLVTEERVEERTVTGQVRKERIEAELPDGKTAGPIAGHAQGTEILGKDRRR